MANVGQARVGGLLAAVLPGHLLLTHVEVRCGDRGGGSGWARRGSCCARGWLSEGRGTSQNETAAKGRTQRLSHPERKGPARTGVFLPPTRDEIKD